MKRILALHALGPKLGEVQTLSSQSNHCSSESHDCSSQSISCPDNDGFALDW